MASLSGLIKFANQLRAIAKVDPEQDWDTLALLAARKRKAYINEIKREREALLDQGPHKLKALRLLEDLKFERENGFFDKVPGDDGSADFDISNLYDRQYAILTAKGNVNFSGSSSSKFKRKRKRPSKTNALNQMVLSRFTIQFFPS